ncbi:MAG: hypothetical protein L0Z70_10340 [Chloroflexi bacterium]|nr:hypothetical protein [Chloroflexota bacterium]
MGFSEPVILSFIVKIWLEESLDEPEQIRWRGRITHVPSGKQQYFLSLSECAVFIREHLQELGVRPSLGREMHRSIRRWLVRRDKRSGE